MKRKDIGLLVSICVLAFLAVFSEKKVQVVEGYYLTTSELKVGGEVFRRECPHVGEFDRGVVAEGAAPVEDDGFGFHRAAAWRVIVAARDGWS